MLRSASEPDPWRTDETPKCNLAKQTQPEMRRRDTRGQAVSPTLADRRNKATGLGRWRNKATGRVRGRRPWRSEVGETKPNDDTRQIGFDFWQNELLMKNAA